jgi:hypothetical protein
LKTVAARGPAAHQPRKSKGKKRKAPPKDDTPASTSSASKRTRVEDADDEDQVQMTSTTSVVPPVVQGTKAQVSHNSFRCNHILSFTPGIGQKESHIFIL